jgi:hypothetical protein
VDKSFFVLKIADVIRIKKEHEITLQDLHQANEYLKEAVLSQEDLIELLQQISVATQSLPKQERQKIYRCVVTLYQNMIAFEEECLRILDFRRSS